MQFQSDLLFTKNEQNQDTQITDYSNNFDSEVQIPVYKIILLGNPNVGKTSIIQQFTQSEFRLATQKTQKLDYSYKKVQLNDKSLAKLQIWDTVGQEKFNSMSKNYYKNAHAAIIVISLENQNSVEQLEKWLLALNQSSAHPSLQKIVIANKIDINSSFYVQAQEQQQNTNKPAKNQLQYGDNNFQNNYYNHINKIEQNTNYKSDVSEITAVSNENDYHNNENTDDDQYGQKQFVQKTTVYESEQDILDQLEFESFCFQNNLKFFYASAKTKFNIENAFQYLAQKIQKNADLFENQKSTTILTAQKSLSKIERYNQNKNCC
ncbi:P-loop containing nucleoside triphosphate hydrolase [Pseudocohnilembus persalinus]|uniref:p-loop containing nucleoside triphosphate hydrolase n=1 Tax=Pseudocohnilembus persalinus TaxID=266149 RepID=A0A0V0QHB5_PSEPJ|nr:P-loop containing nucleoside triphosphate hydrolase [Pseudocohnilembus persalinus]|eukprot:KRX01649.1 P-loop containing nucleoside triphosphate hydrolase [Pseudocohnilembus persalinus]